MSLSHTHTLSLSPSLSLTHTHTHSLSLSFSLSLSLSLSLTHTHTHTHTIPMASHCLWIKDRPLNMISVLAWSGPYLPFRWSQSLYLHPYLLYLTHSWLPVAPEVFTTFLARDTILLIPYFSKFTLWILQVLVNAQFLKGEIRLEHIFLFSVPITQCSSRSQLLSQLEFYIYMSG